MAAPQFTPEQLQHIRDLAARWGKIVARRVFGDAGPGLDADLATLERIALAAAGGLTDIFVTWRPGGARSWPDASSATRGPDSTPTWPPWNESPLPPRAA